MPQKRKLPVLIEGAWVLAFGVILLLLISAFRLVERDGRKQADPFGAIEMLDWRWPDQWRHARGGYPLNGSIQTVQANRATSAHPFLSMIG